MVKPISPDEVVDQKKKDIPDIVMETWNSNIARNYTSGSSTIGLTDIKDALCAVTGKTRNEIYKLGYLDIEDVYRAAGWSVFYDTPAYNETYEASYTFKKK